MKFLLIALFFLSPKVHADCPHCYLWDWGSWFPILKIPEWPVEFVKVEKHDLARNEDIPYCTRPVEMLDTIVIHHSAGSATSSTIEVNNYHINRDWHMIGYSYVINTPYAGSNKPPPTVTEGRPMDMVGSHAGTNAFVTMTKEQQSMWDAGKIVCGKVGEPFTIDPNQIRNGKIKANVTTLGLAVLGNYAPFSRYNPTGYSPRNPRHPTQKTLELTAKMSCQLQKKYPGIKYIKWHSLYNFTSCPGNLKQNIEKIKKIAKGYGCDFK